MKGIKLTKQLTQISGKTTVRQVDDLKVRRDKPARKKRV